MDSNPLVPPTPPPGLRRYQAVVGPRLARVLAVVFVLFAILVVNSAYLAAITIAGPRHQNWFYLIMFLAHLVLGLVLVVPFIVFATLHARSAHPHRNRRAVRVGWALLTTAVVLLGTGLVLTRVEAFGVQIGVAAGTGRDVAYWLHVGTPVVAAWLFVLHRLAGRRLKWQVAVAVAGLAVVFAGVMVVLAIQDPRAWATTGPESGEQYFKPSFARTATGDFIPAAVLQADDYCRECHADVHEQWAASAHRFSSFNNPAYLFSVLETRRVVTARDGSVDASRWCAGCHDPVPFFSGAFDEPRFDDPDYDLASDSIAQAGITCTACHSITHVDGVKGNAQFTIEEPLHYPFAFSESPFLRWVNRQLVKAKPAYHRATFMKEEVHRSTEFCSTCHKVSLLPEVNGYKWLRGQNHHDAFLLSGVSGHFPGSFYYPPKAVDNCQACHQPFVKVSDAPNFGASGKDQDGRITTRSHRFPGANTALPHLLPDRMPKPEEQIEVQRAFLEGALRVDIFGLREGGRIDAPLIAPLRPELPVLAPGGRYLLEMVLRTLRVGHVFTQGTSDSNEVWVEVTARSGERVIGRSGWREDDGSVDPWAWFVNAFVLDRDGNRIDRRNAQDIFTPLYNHQIPPGAAAIAHHALDVPLDATEPVTIEARLLYRKFDTRYVKLFTGDPERVNDLPIVEIARDRVTLPLAGAGAVADQPLPAAPEWERWNDYGISLLLEGALGELAQAREAFARVEALGRPDGPLNLARVLIKEGLVQEEAPAALARAAAFDPPAPPWVLAWLTAEVAAENGDPARAVEALLPLVNGGLPGAAERGFDFSKDHRVLSMLGRLQWQQGLRAQGDARRQLVSEARGWFERALERDPEDLASHWGLMLVARESGDAEAEQRHADLHARYAPDDNARDSAVAAARRRYPAADRAAEAIVFTPLRPPGVSEPPPRGVAGGTR